MTSLLKNIIETVSYHDLFDFPLTVQEISLNISGESGQFGLAGIVTQLQGEEAGNFIGSQNGFWFLKGREEIVETRLGRYNIAENKYKIVKKFFRLAKHAPFLRAVFVCNTLSRSNARDESDIDLFVVAEPGRMWITRLFVTGLAALQRKRPTETISADRLCLSFFITADALNLKSHAIEKDVYLPHWLLDLYPVYDESGAANNIFIQNSWARKELPGLKRQLMTSRRSVKGSKSKLKTFAESLIEKKGDYFESLARALQMKLMPEKLKNSAEENTGVVITDSILKLHGTDRRREFRDRYFEKIQQKEYARAA